MALGREAGCQRDVHERLTGDEGSARERDPLGSDDLTNRRPEIPPKRASDMGGMDARIAGEVGQRVLTRELVAQPLTDSRNPRRCCMVVT